MTLEEDISAFQLWAINLGCPPDAIPNEEALASIFKSRQRDLFCNMMKRVVPRQEALEVRENILINKMAKLKDQIVPACSRSFLPKEMQIFLKIKDLKSRKDESQLRLEEYKREYDSVAASIKTKNIQSISLKRKHEVLQAKVNMLEFKNESLGKSIAKEEKNREQVNATMPVKLTSKNASESAAMEGVKKALKELDSFYKLYINNNKNSHILQEAKDDLWKKMRNIFANVPNFLLFNAVMRLKEEQLQNLMSLNKANLDDTRTLSSSAAKGPLSAFEMKIMKTRGDLLGMVAKYLAARQERKVLEERFTIAYNPFVDQLQKKVDLFNGNAGENMEETISEFLVQYNFLNFSKSRNEFLKQQSDLFKAEIESDAKHLENHEVLLGTIKEVYSDINASINRVQYEMLQLGQIKEKIIYSKNMLQHMLNDMQTTTASATAAASSKSNFLSTKLKMNSNASIIGGDSFDISMGSDTVFCSTKLDFDSTITSLSNSILRRSVGAADVTLLPAAGGNIDGRYNLPSHSMELNTFAETPFEFFNCMTQECAFYLSPHPLIVDARELSSTIQLAPGLLLTPFGALQEVRKRILWADSIAAHSNGLKLDLELPLVQPQLFKQKMKQQIEDITELLDKISICGDNANHTLQKVAKIYKFMLENPLRQYIPASKCFNNQTYTDFEAEFTMYYRMSTVGMSKK